MPISPSLASKLLYVYGTMYVRSIYWRINKEGRREAAQQQQQRPRKKDVLDFSLFQIGWPLDFAQRLQRLFCDESRDGTLALQQCQKVRTTWYIFHRFIGRRYVRYLGAEGDRRFCTPGEHSRLSLSSRHTREDEELCAARLILRRTEASDDSRQSRLCLLRRSTSKRDGSKAQTGERVIQREHPTVLLAATYLIRRALAISRSHNNS